VNATRAVILLGLILVLGAVNYSIYGKERIIADGETIFLELAPVDPRSLMQGDYMALRFRVADEIERARESGSLSNARRSAPLMIDERGIAAFAAPGERKSEQEPLSIRFRVRSDRVWLGTNAYFFEEGSAQRFEDAKFGEFKVERASGEAVLIGLRGADLQAL
jgi:uncharacterized membrane-anchored protein